MSIFQARLPSGHEMFGAEMVKAFIEFLYCGQFGLLAQIYQGRDLQIAVETETVSSLGA